MLVLYFNQVSYQIFCLIIISEMDHTAIKIKVSLVYVLFRLAGLRRYQPMRKERL